MNSKLFTRQNRPIENVSRLIEEGKKLKWMKEQLPEFKACISKHYPLFVNIYQFYSATGEGDPFDMGMNDFQVLLRACNIGDVYLGSVWYAVNFHGTASYDIIRRKIVNPSITIWTKMP